MTEEALRERDERKSYIIFEMTLQRALLVFVQEAVKKTGKVHTLRTHIANCVATALSTELCMCV